MKKRDFVLFSLPLTAILAVAAFAWFLYAQTNRFEATYLDEAKANVAEEAKLVSAVIAPMLKAGKITEAVRFCDSFAQGRLRLTLIDASGKVAADSRENSAFLDNHINREEVVSALRERPISVVRYSESLGQWMIYHAMPISSSDGVYVLRAAVSTDKVSSIINFSRLNMFWALLFGGELVLILFVYIVRKVRRPLIGLQRSVESVASGRLDTEIEIPESGLVRELALGVSEMSEQLKSRLAEVTAERNERELLFDTMDESVLLFDGNGGLLRANRAAAELFDFDPDEGRFDLARCQIPELLTAARETLRTGTGFEKEFILPRGGGERVLWIKAHSLEQDGEKRLFLTVTELTGLRKLEAFRSDFVANVSHEIKTPLTCIVGAVEALEDDPPAAQRKTLFDMLKKQSKRLNNLVGDILSLAALEKEQRNPERSFAPVRLDAVVVNAANLCRSHAEQSHLHLLVAENTPLTISGDAALLEQSLVNLIENAIKYSGGSSIVVALRQSGSNAVLEVRDDGVGIPLEHRARIFERFYRVDKSRSRELGGTGLGLAIVKHIAQLHGGRAELGESDRGCTFRLVLPL